MDRYQEALNKIKIMGDKDLYNEHHVEWANILQEFLDQNKPLTLDECYKKWEEKGWHIHQYYRNEITCSAIQISQYIPSRKDNGFQLEIHIQFKPLNVLCNFGMGIDEFNLLTKTIKALEKENVQDE